MKKINFNYIRLLVISIFISLFAFLFSQVFFLVTNSNLNEIIPLNQTFIPIEEDIMDVLDWSFDGSEVWSVSNQESFSGSYSFKSGQISNNQYSLISLDIHIFDDGYIDFWYLVDSEYSTSGEYFYDGLQFFIDGELLGQFQPDTNGDSEWEYANFPITAGFHSIAWSYVKDGSDGITSSDEDCVWIDDLSFPDSDLGLEFNLEFENQLMTSGLFSAVVHPLNNGYIPMKAKGGTLSDFDLDGDLDLYYGYTSSFYFENKNNEYVNLTDIMNIDDRGSRGTVVGDIDNNGYTDILKWRYYFNTSYPHLLLLNNGNHHFETIEYLDNSEMQYLHSQGLIDVDLDGDLDIVAVEKEGSSQFHCFLNNTLNGETPNYNRAFTYLRDDENSSSRTLAIADIDGDGDQDVYVPRKEGRNWLFINQTLQVIGNEIIYNSNPNPLFVESSIQYGVSDELIELSGSTGYGAAWGDYDNDQDMDLYLSNWGVNRLYNNQGNIFINVAEDSPLESDSLSNGAGWGDFNNDGNLDIWAANFKRGDDIIINNGMENWDVISPNFMSATQDVVPVDYNNDGNLDMFTPGLQMAHGNGPTNSGFKYTSLLYKNINNDSLDFNYNWVSFDLEGAMNGYSNNGWSNKSNKSAIGARIILSLGSNTIMREIIAGKGHGSMDPLRLHFGLGSNQIIDTITIKWPSKDSLLNEQKVTILDGPFETNRIYKIVEDIGFVGKKGDFNLDGLWNILDVVNLINYVLSNNSFIPPDIFWAVDMDYTNELNILDVVKLVNFIINQL